MHSRVKVALNGRQGLWEREMLAQPRKAHSPHLAACPPVLSVTGPHLWHLKRGFFFWFEATLAASWAAIDRTLRLVSSNSGGI